MKLWIGVVLVVLFIATLFFLAISSPKQCVVVILNTEYLDSCCVKIEGHQGEEINSTLIFVSDLLSEEEVAKIEVSPDNKIPSWSNIMCPFGFNASEITGMTFSEQRINFTKCQSIPKTKQVMLDCERRLGGGLR